MQRDSRQVQKGLNKDQDKTPPYDSLGEEKDEESTPLEAAPTPAKLAAPESVDDSFQTPQTQVKRASLLEPAALNHNQFSTPIHHQQKDNKTLQLKKKQLAFYFVGKPHHFRFFDLLVFPPPNNHELENNIIKITSSFYPDYYALLLLQAIAFAAAPAEELKLELKAKQHQENELKFTTENPILIDIFEIYKARFLPFLYFNNLVTTLNETLEGLINNLGLSGFFYEGELFGDIVHTRNPMSYNQTKHDAGLRYYVALCLEKILELLAKDPYPITESLDTEVTEIQELLENLPLMTQEASAAITEKVQAVGGTTPFTTVKKKSKKNEQEESHNSDSEERKQQIHLILVNTPLSVKVLNYRKETLGDAAVKAFNSEALEIIVKRDIEDRREKRLSTTQKPRNLKLNLKEAHKALFHSSRESSKEKEEKKEKEKDESESPKDKKEDESESPREQERSNSPILTPEAKGGSPVSSDVEGELSEARLQDSVQISTCSGLFNNPSNEVEAIRLLVQNTIFKKQELKEIVLRIMLLQKHLEPIIQILSRLGDEKNLSTNLQQCKKDIIACRELHQKMLENLSMNTPDQLGELIKKVETAKDTLSTHFYRYPYLKWWNKTERDIHTRKLGTLHLSLNQLRDKSNIKNFWENTLNYPSQFDFPKVEAKDRRLKGIKAVQQTPLHNAIEKAIIQEDMKPLDQYTGQFLDEKGNYNATLLKQLKVSGQGLPPLHFAYNFAQKANDQYVAHLCFYLDKLEHLFEPLFCYLNQACDSRWTSSESVKKLKIKKAIILNIKGTFARMLFDSYDLSTFYLKFLAEKDLWLQDTLFKGCISKPSAYTARNKRRGREDQTYEDAKAKLKDKRGVFSSTTWSLFQRTIDLSSEELEQYFRPSFNHYGPQVATTTIGTADIIYPSRRK